MYISTMAKKVVKEEMMTKVSRIITMDVEVTNLDQAVEKVLALANSKKGSYVCLSNVHMCMETFDSPEFQKIVNSADLVLPDGRPIYWMQKLLGAQNAEQVRGLKIMSALCEKSVTKEIKIGLYGGISVEVLKEVKQELRLRYPGINLAYTYSPPYRDLGEAETNQVLEEINAAEVDILFVGIGCPKQEYWMATHKSHLNCVMLGVGAAFDFISKRKMHAPRWLQTIGLEWIFRLVLEPRRLSKRYFKHNPRFIYYFACQWLFGRTYK